MECTNRQLKHDGQIQIATAPNKTSKQWKNKTMSWREFAIKLSSSTVTPETIEEYNKMSKEDKDNTKDVGGFVGGTLKGGKRTNQNIQTRTLLTLDMDYAPKTNIWEVIELLCDYTVLMYSTHSHTVDNPRYRLIIPLSRPVLADEYQALGRLIAKDIGIDLFDDTTYEPARLMFYPSTSSDAKYVFKLQDLKWLDVDRSLARYEFGWQDVSFWPESSRTKAKMIANTGDQQDPTAKRGIIGAFCRTYSISECIDKFLANVYIQTDKEDRYTYVNGSTSCGIVTYQDKWSYSHHATDPASMILCNSFDLLRLHLFDGDDKATIESIIEDEKVKLTLNKERIEKAKLDFESVNDEDWLIKLELDNKGIIKSTSNNIKLILENDPNLKGKLRYNEFSCRNTVIGELPWRTEESSDWEDLDDAGLRSYLETLYNVVSIKKIDDVLKIVFNSNSFHPVKNYLDNLVWDGVERIDRLFIDYLGAADCIYTKLVTRKSLIGAVKRIYEPGCKLDTTLVLTGPQGKGKTTILRRLGGDWFSNSLDNVTGKEAYEQLQGNWIIELGELKALKGKETKDVKLFLTKQEDIYREAYQRRTKIFKRQCAFFGTTNDLEFLNDPTGNRRFWPIDIYEISPIKDVFNMEQYNIDMIWAEAIESYKNGEITHLTKEEEKLALEQQKIHTEQSSKVGLIKAFLDRKITENWDKKTIAEKREYISGDGFDASDGDVERTRICAIEIWCELFNGEPKNLTQNTSREINDILSNLDNWYKAKGSISFGKYYGKQRGYIRK